MKEIDIDKFYGKDIGEYLKTMLNSVEEDNVPVTGTVDRTRGFPIRIIMFVDKQ